ncbi:MAG: CDP-diacylglycerol--glycerol-3-phosphate 3-phosphatidyltransferase [bacterium]|nr:CDP-diacylglycerol--glycerol-3-phosphate 3-phosphatidyltransferase [bacterium]
MAVFSHWPNRITAMRFVGALALFAIFAIVGDRTPAEIEDVRTVICFAFWLFVVTAATDFLDGYLARRDKLVSAFGRIADPFTDKVLILGTMIFAAVMPWTQPWMPAWVVVVILAREFLVTGIRGYAESQGQEFPADNFGKVKMVVQSMAVGGLIWMEAYDWPDGWFRFWSVVVHVLVWATLIATVGSGVTYVTKASKLFTEEGA